MRKIIGLMAGVAVLCAPVCVFATGFGSFVSSFKSPGAYPSGVSCRRGEIYIATWYGVIFRTTPKGSIINYHPTKLRGLSGITVGTVGGSTYYWVGTTEQSYVYRFVDNSSTIHGSFPVPGGLGQWRGLTFVDNTHMYFANQNENRLYLLHPMTGFIYSSYGLTFGPNDLTYDNSGYLWIASAGDKAVYKCRLNGTPVASFSTVAYEYPQGCGFDGEYLWVGCGNPAEGRNYIVQFEVRSEPAVAPASLGRVKALYR
jgi:hypothetical protein